MSRVFRYHGTNLENVENMKAIHGIYLFRCEDEVAFVLPPFIVRYNDTLPFLHSLNGCQN